METSQLKEETILSLKDYLYKLENGVNNCINFLRKGNEGEGLKCIGYIIEGLNWCIEAISLTSDSNLNNIDISGIEELLQEIIYAMENKDYALLADIFEYEVNPLVKKWQSGLLLQ